MYYLHHEVSFLVIVVVILCGLYHDDVDAFITPFLSRMRHSSFIHSAKRKSKKSKSNSKNRAISNNTNKNSNGNNNNDNVEEQFSLAAKRPIASVAGVTEEHNFEQFFYSEKSTMSIYQIAKSYSFPLFLCNPSLAVLAEEAKVPYLLLDRDRRFQFLSKYKEFSLLEPFLVSSYSYDVVFIDPPFANITPMQLVNCLKLMAPSKDMLKVPVYIAYNSKREKDLLDAFATLPCPKMERLWRLEYRSVRDDLKIYLYGPSNI